MDALQELQLGSGHASYLTNSQIAEGIAGSVSFTTAAAEAIMIAWLRKGNNQLLPLSVLHSHPLTVGSSHRALAWPDKS